MGPVRAAGLVAAGVGVVAAAVGGGLLGNALVTFQHCQQTPCQMSAEPRGQETIGSAMLIGGGVLIVAGVVAFLVGPRPRETAAPPSAYFWVDPRGAAGVVTVF
jgi:hypothetical protein